MKIGKSKLPAARQKKVIVRSPTLTTARVSVIVELIRGGPSGMTWDDVRDLVEQNVGPRYSRQALSNNDDIRLAYEARRSPRSGNVQELEALADIAQSAPVAEVGRLRRRIAELEIRQNHLLETLARWIVNAGEAGLDEAFLNRPLPEITRAKNY